MNLCIMPIPKQLQNNEPAPSRGIYRKIACLYILVEEKKQLGRLPITIRINLRVSPHSFYILFADCEAGDPHVIRNIVDDECAEPSVTDERYGESQIDEDRRILPRGLDYRFAVGGRNNQVCTRLMVDGAYRPIIRGRLASNAPTTLQSHIQSHHGKDVLVTWARIILPT